MTKDVLLPRTNHNTDFRFQSVKTIVLKITHRCNTDCNYCYENISAGKDMASDSAKKIINLLLSNTTQREVTILFHGGEPTLLSYEWFDEVLQFAISEAAIFNKSIRFTIQSNLINVSESKLELFRKHNVSIGVSIDNIYSELSNQRKKSAIVLDKIKNIVSNGMKVGILSTINHSNFYRLKEIMIYLYDELNIKSFKANPIYSVGAGLNLPSLMPENYFQAYKDMIDYMIETKGNSLVEKNLVIEIIRFFSNDESGVFRQTLCHEKQCGAGKTVLGITTEGYIFPCGRFQWDEYGFYIGNISEADFDVTNYNTSLTNFQNLVPENWYNCNECKAKKICSFGCQAFINRSISKANVECLPTQMKYNYMESRRDELFEVYSNLKGRYSLKEFSYHDKEDEEEELEINSKQLASFVNMYTDSGDDSGDGYIDAVDI